MVEIVDVPNTGETAEDEQKKPVAQTSEDEPDQPITRTATHDYENKGSILGKCVLNGFIAAFLYVWWDLLGNFALPPLSYIAALMSPLSLGFAGRARQEVRAVVTIYFGLATSPFLPVWCLKKRNPLATGLLLLYMTWYLFFDKAPQRGGRFFPALRRRQFWKNFAAYFPMSLTRTCKLDPSKNYIFGYHPHGIISVGAMCNFATDATGFSELFPGIDMRLLTLALNFRFPLYREYLLGLGVNDASRQSVMGNMRRGPGAAVMIVVGGARESLESAPGNNNLLLENRKGFVKMALVTGASLVPVFSFGETDVYGVWHSERFKRFQLMLQKKLGFAIPFFFGRALTGGLLHRVFGFNRGVMPLRMPVHSVVGRPIHVDAPVANPTQEQIDELHARYVEELRRTYDEWKDQFQEEREKALKAEGDSPLVQQRVQILERGDFDIHRSQSLDVIG